MAESDSELGPLSIVSQEHSETESATKTEDSLPHEYSLSLSQTHIGEGGELQVTRNYMGGSEGEMDEEETSDEQDASSVGAGGMAAVVVWLQSLGLDQYRQVFEDDGFDSVDAVRAIHETDLVAMGVKTGHIRLIMKNLPPAPGTQDLVTKAKRVQRKPYATRAAYLATIPYKLPIPTNPHPNNPRGYAPTRGMVLYGQRGSLPLPPRSSEPFGSRFPQGYTRPILAPVRSSPPKRPRGRPRKPTVVNGPPTTSSNMYYSPYTQPVYMAPQPSAPATSPSPTNQSDSPVTAAAPAPLATSENGMQPPATSPTQNVQQMPPQTPSWYWRPQAPVKARVPRTLRVEPKPHHMGPEGAGFRLFSQILYNAAGEPIKRKRGRPRKYPIVPWNEQHGDHNGSFPPTPQLLGHDVHAVGSGDPGGDGEEEPPHTPPPPIAIALGEVRVYPDSEPNAPMEVGDESGGMQHEHEHEHEQAHGLDQQVTPSKPHLVGMILPPPLSLGTATGIPGPHDQG